MGGVELLAWFSNFIAGHSSDRGSAISCRRNICCGLLHFTSQLRLRANARQHGTILSPQPRQQAIPSEASVLSRPNNVEASPSHESILRLPCHRFSSGSYWLARNVGHIENLLFSTPLTKSKIRISKPHKMCGRWSSDPAILIRYGLSESRSSKTKTQDVETLRQLRISSRPRKRV